MVSTAIMWRVALLLVLAVSASAQNEDSDRLLTSVIQPVILEVDLPRISVGFKSGPNVPGTQFTIKCVVEGDGCDAPGLGQSVNGYLPVKPAAVEGTVQGLDLDQTYTCYVETYLSADGKVSFCREAKPIPGVVKLELIFSAYPNATAFGQPEQDQLCANVLSLQPGGLCTILSVKDGSAAVFLEVKYSDYRDAWSLFFLLTDVSTQRASQSVEDILSQGLEGRAEIVRVEVDPAPPVILPKFYRGANGVTILCPNAVEGDTGIVDGVEYTYRNASGLRELASNATTWGLLSTSCISGVEDLSSLFDDRSQTPGFFDSFNVDISTWDTSNVVDMHRMFSGAASFNQAIENWNTSSVVDMGSMFDSAVSFNQTLAGWNTGHVINMGGMFRDAVSFNQTIDTWVVQNVRNTDSMFAGATSFNQPIGSWDTRKVEDMDSMFAGATSFNRSIGDWDTSNVVDMHGLFAGATAFDQPIGDWDTSNVEDMDSMFKGCSVFNQPLDKWNTGRVMDMDSMFENAVAYNQDLSMWNVALVTSCFRFSEGATTWQDSLKPPLTCNQCFPADAIVYTHDRGPMQMRNVRIGDRLLTYSDAGEAIYDDVYMIGHKDEASFAVFLSITASNNQTIRLTPDHHIFVVRDDKMSEIPSRKVEVGDGLVVNHGEVLSVVAISHVTSQGLFNPYTRNGRIVVDGILASCHSSSVLDDLFHQLGIPVATGYQIAFAPIRFLYSILGPRVFLRLEWIIDAAATICNRGWSFQDLFKFCNSVAITSAYCMVATSSFLGLKP